MQIVVTAFLDQLYEQLAEGSRLVTLYKEKDASFIPALESWLEASEAVLEKNRRSQVGEIAGIRAQLLAASNGVYDKNSFAIPATDSRRKICQANAALLFNNAQRILNSLFATFLARKDEADKYMRQMILIALQKNSFYPIWNSSLGIPDKLTALWESFLADNDLVQGTRQILSLVHYVDALRVLDEAIGDLRL